MAEVTRTAVMLLVKCEHNGLFLSSLSVIPMLQCLHVHEFCVLFSNSHNPVSLDMQVGYWYTSSDSSTDTTERTKLWDAEKVQTFISF